MSGADELEIENTEVPEEEEQDLITYEISYYPTDFTLQVYRDKWDAGQLEIPPFQRNYVWDQVQASKLIESFLLGLPVPGVFLYKDRKSNRLAVIDGQQRILSAVRYFRGDFDGKPFHLKRVHPKWDGKAFDELIESDRLQLEDTVLRATVVQQLDPNDDSSIYHIFERLNTGGTKLTPMEIRKCVYFGAFMSELEALNTGDDWREIVGSKKHDKRLRDVEFILRVMAMSMAWETYEKPMKQFLNSFMATYQNDDATGGAIKALVESFKTACGTAVNELGPKPFHLRGRLNLAVLDSVLGTIMRIGEVDQLEKRYTRLTTNEDYLQAVSIDTSDTAVVTKRFQLAEQYFTR